MWYVTTTNRIIWMHRDASDGCRTVAHFSLMHICCSLAMHGCLSVRLCMRENVSVMLCISLFSMALFRYARSHTLTVSQLSTDGLCNISFQFPRKQAHHVEHAAFHHSQSHT